MSNGQPGTRSICWITGWAALVCCKSSESLFWTRSAMEFRNCNRGREKTSRSALAPRLQSAARLHWAKHSFPVHLWFFYWYLWRQPFHFEGVSYIGLTIARQAAHRVQGAGIDLVIRQQYGIRHVQVHDLAEQDPTRNRP